jgi:hypothetical protein
VLDELRDWCAARRRVRDLIGQLEHLTERGDVRRTRDHLARADVAISTRVAWRSTSSRGSGGQGGVRAHAEAGRLRCLAGQGLPVFADPAARHPHHVGGRQLGAAASTSSTSTRPAVRCRAGVEGLPKRATRHARSLASVTVLTSEPTSARTNACAGMRVRRRRARAPMSTSRARLRTMVPGIRLAGGDAHDQARVDTPGDAIERGADWLVLGRAVTGADDPENAARQVTRVVAEALIRRPA